MGIYYMQKFKIKQNLKTFFSFQKLKIVWLKQVSWVLKQKKIPYKIYIKLNMCEI